MQKPRTSAAPLIIAIALLVLPVVYVASYLALVSPCGFQVVFYYPTKDPQNPFVGNVDYIHYRFAANVSGKLFWPLEQIDRKVRPQAWETPIFELGVDPPGSTLMLKEVPSGP